MKFFYTYFLIPLLFISMIVFSLGYDHYISGILLICFVPYTIITAYISLSDYFEFHKVCIHNTPKAFNNPDLCSQCTDEKLKRKYLIDKINDLEKIKKNQIEKNQQSLEKVYGSIRNILKNDIEYLRKLNPFKFEKEIGGLFKKMGYQVEITSKSNDKGKDIVLTKNNQITYVECKRFAMKQRVSRPALQKLVGAMVVDNVKNGVMVTTSGFTKECIEFANKLELNIKLIDSKELLSMFSKNFSVKDKSIKHEMFCVNNLILDTQDRLKMSTFELENKLKSYKKQCGDLVSFSLEDEYVHCKHNHYNINESKSYYDKLIIEIDSVCPICYVKLVKRKQKTSRKSFLGCPNYPSCRYTKSL